MDKKEIKTDLHHSKHQILMWCLNMYYCYEILLWYLILLDRDIYLTL